MHLPQTIERMLLNGATVSIDASQYIPISLERFAHIANQTGGKLILRNCERLIPVTLERLSTIGKKNVSFTF